MMKRCLMFISMAFALCLGSFTAQASERIEYLHFSIAGLQSYGAEAARHEATLAEWRTSGSVHDESLASNLIAISNHFGMVSAAPFGVPDWDSMHSA